MIRNLLAGGISIAISVVVLSGEMSPEESNKNKSLILTEVASTNELIMSTALYRKSEALELKIDSFHLEVEQLKNEKVIQPSFKKSQR